MISPFDRIKTFPLIACNLELNGVTSCQRHWCYAAAVATFLLRNSLNLKQKFIAAEKKTHTRTQKRDMREMEHEKKERHF